MAQRGTTIKLFLADGKPDGLWVAQKSGWTGMFLMATRARYIDLRERPEMNAPGVYVLIGPPTDGVKATRIYVGETDVLKDRLDYHQKNSDFWTKVVVFTAKDDNLNKAHVRYLESRLLEIAIQADRAEIDNANASAKPGLSEADLADMEAFLDDMLLIYPVLGLSAFEVQGQVETEEGDRLFLKDKSGAYGEGFESSDGFVVLKGALARRAVTPGMQEYGVTLRESLTKSGVLVADGEYLRLDRNYTFSSPSNASMTLLGRSSNGRLEWANSEGTSLKALQERAITRI